MTLRTKTGTQRTVRDVCPSTSRGQRLPDRAVRASPDFANSRSTPSSRGEGGYPYSPQSELPDQSSTRHTAAEEEDSTTQGGKSTKCSRWETKHRHRREKRPQNRQAEWEKREALQASRRAPPRTRVSLSRIDLLFGRSKAGRIASQMWEANNLPWLPTQTPLHGGSSK